MNKDIHPIDSMFEHAMEGLTVEPRSDSWNAVSASIDKVIAKRKKRKLLWRWMGVTVFIAAVISLFSIRSCSLSGERLNYNMNQRKTQPNTYIILTQSNVSSPQYSNSNHSINSLNQATSSINNKQTIHSNQTKASIAKTHYTTANSTNIQATAAFKSQKQNALVAQKAHLSKSSFSLSNDEIISDNFEHFEILPFKLYADVQLQGMSKLTKPFLFDPAISTGLTIEMAFGPSVLINNLPSINSFDEPVVEYNQNDVFPSYEAFVHLKYSFSNFYVKTGIQISEFGHNADYEFTVEKHDTSGGYASWILDRFWTYDTIGWFDDPFTPGMVYPILEPTYHIDTVGSQWNSRNKVYYEKLMASVKNRYRYVEIPLIMGAQYIHKRFTYYGGAGVSFGQMINVEGKYLQNGELLAVSEDFNPYNSHNFNYLLQAGVTYALNNRWNALIQTNYKSNITSIYKAEFNQNTKFHSISIQLGLSYNIK